VAANGDVDAVVTTKICTALGTEPLFSGHSDLTTMSYIYI